MNFEYDKFDDDRNIIRDTKYGIPVVIDRIVLDELLHSKQKFKIGNDIYEYRDVDNDGITGMEHIAKKKHGFKVQDIQYIEDCINKLEGIYKDRRNIYKRCIYLSGTFGVNNDKPYLKVVIDIRSKKIITAYPTRNIFEGANNKLNSI